MKDRKTIVDDIIKETATTIPQVNNYRVGGVFRTFIEVVASFLEKIYQELELLLPNRFLTTAQGKWLDMKAEELSLKRYQANKTKGNMIFSRENSSSLVTINKDKIIATKSGLRYKVFADVDLKEGESSKKVLVEAEEVGAKYNVIHITEFITPISGIDSISTPNDWITEIGKDIETDDSLRGRCLALWQGLGGANKGAYIAWCKTVEGVGDVRVISTARGLGTVDVVFVGVNNIHPDETLIKKVKKVIDDKKPIATNVEVKAPSKVIIDTNITVKVLPNYELTKDFIKDKVYTYFTNLEIGNDFEPSALVRSIFDIEGVKSVVVNSPTSQRVSELQIASVGEIAVELSNAIEK